MSKRDELEGLFETVHLMRSPKNAQRLLAALGRALSQQEATSTLDKLQKEVGLS